MSDISQITWPKTTFPIVVDYDSLIEDLFIRYGNVDARLSSEHFPETAKGNKWLRMALTRFEIFRNGNPFSISDSIWGSPYEERDTQTLQRMKQKGLRFASAKELATFGSIYPNLCEYRSIVAMQKAWIDPDGLAWVPRLVTHSRLSLGVTYFHLTAHETMDVHVDILMVLI